MKFVITATLALMFSFGTPVWAEEPAWGDIKDAVFGDQFLIEGKKYIEIEAPYRAEDDGRVNIGANINLAPGDLLKSVHVILDNNPVPVSAVFTLADPMPRFNFDVTMRINGPTPLHVTAQTSTGKIFMVETFIKTSGLGACSAPPGTDAEEALATLGEMIIQFEDPVQELATLGSDQSLGLQSGPNENSMATVDLSHPSHSGLQMDQITLLFLPMRAVQTLDVNSDTNPYLNIEGSISLSENPSVSFSVPQSTFELGVTMTDTDGTVTTAKKNRLVQ